MEIKSINTMRPEQHGRHFTDGISKCIFLNENYNILIQISLKFVPKDPIDHISPLVQLMACRQIGDKPLPEPMLTKFYGAILHCQATSNAGLILGLGPTNEGWCYFVTTSLIGWGQA